MIQAGYCNLQAGCYACHGLSNQNRVWTHGPDNQHASCGQKTYMRSVYYDVKASTVNIETSCTVHGISMYRVK